MKTTASRITRVLRWIGLVVAFASLRDPVYASGEDSVVILLNARNPTQTLPAAEIKKLFLGQTAFWHGVVPVKVVIRPDGSKASKVFYESVLGMTPAAYRKHWDEVQLAGRGVAPKALNSAEEVAAAITQTPGGIGFALASEAWQLQSKTVKTIEVH
ncbi:MAG: hypothetical protein RL701_1393 [Pseudomonadota bacterium]